MQNRYNDATPQRPKGGRPIDAPIVKFDLVESLSLIREEPAYKKNDRNAITLFKSDNLSIVLISFHEGAEMKTHSTEGLCSLQVLDGEIAFTIGDHTLDLQDGEIVTVHEGVPHSLLATSESAILLTIAANIQTGGK